MISLHSLARLLVVYGTVLAITVGCAKKNQAASSSNVSGGSSYSAADWAACNDNITADYVKSGATQIIPYYINSVMTDPTTGNTVCTPRAIRQKIKDIFDLYASIPEAGFAFRYAGPDTIDYTQPGYDPLNRPSYLDGAIHVVLTNTTTAYDGFGDDDTLWGLPHSGPNNSSAADDSHYNGGVATVVLHDTGAHQRPGAISFGLLFHEIGHALGMNHIPAKGANMSRYTSGFTGAGSAPDFYAFTEQERANLAAAVPAAGITIYQISGTVAGAPAGNAVTSGVVGSTVDVLAVDVTNGRTYSILAPTGGGTFYLNVLHPGSYRLVVIPDGYPGMGFDPSAYQASWYVNNTTSTNDPTAGTVVTVNAGTPKVSGLTLNLTNTASAYYLAGGNVEVDTSDPTFVPYYMSPGDSGTFDFFVLCGGSSNVAHCDYVTSLEPYGTSPDYTFSNLTITNDLGAFGAFYSVKVTVNSNAAPGHRIAIGRAASGTVQAFLPGVHILGSSAKPVNATTTYNYLQQIGGYFDFTSLIPTWWQ